jgi:hypothetical protein
MMGANTQGIDFLSLFCGYPFQPMEIPSTAQHSALWTANRWLL